MGLFNDRLSHHGHTHVPVWFMRQAGRYHSHYQNIRKNSDFMTMCKTPELANEITHGPIDDFGFNAAILFSDLLYPLENLGLGLSYMSGPPTLEVRLDTLETCKKLTAQKGIEYYEFQKKSCQLLRKTLAKDVTLLGFTGAPFTLYAYAAEGSHAGNLIESKKGLFDGRFDAFYENLKGEILNSLKAQVQGGADAVCLFDTAVGELTLTEFKTFTLPKLKDITAEFKKDHPETKVIYYSKLTHMNYLHAIEDENIDVLGIDWRHDLNIALKELSTDYYIQGNFDPSLLHLPHETLKTRLDQWKQELMPSREYWHKWVAGLGHGVLQHTPEENVRYAVKFIQKEFTY